MRKRITSILMACMLLVSMIPSAFAASDNSFTDVSSTDWYYDEVMYAYENDLMKGTSTTTFSPDATTSRAMIVTILYRLENEPAVSTVGTFTDVAAGQYYVKAVEWAAANGIVGGYGNGLFGPNDLLTREQMAAILYRYADYKGYDVSGAADLSGYTDAASISAYALPAMQWANYNGLVNGTSATTLSPAGAATRAQFAVILYRFCETVAADPSYAEYYTVTFEYNYGSKGTYKTETVEEGETVDQPSNPTRSGYSFSGWYTKATGGSKFDFDTEITADLTLYAHWSSNSSGGSSPSHIHNYSYSANDDGTHVKHCSCGSVTESCSFGSFTHDTANHSRTCELCNYVETEAHSFSNNSSTWMCNTCEYSFIVETPDAVAAIDGAGYTTLAEAVENAKSGNVITLLDNISLTGTVNIEIPITLNGNGKTISAAETFSGKLLEIKFTEGASVANVTLSGSQDSGMQVYESQNVTLSDVTIKDCAKAGLLVNASTVTAHNLNASGNAWGSVNVDIGDVATSTPSFSLTGDSTLGGGNTDKNHQIWSELCNWDVVDTPAGYYKYNYVRAKDGEEFYVWTTSDPTELSVAKDNKGHYYQTLELAVKRPADEHSVTLLVDTTETQVKIPEGKSITIVGEQDTTAFTGQFKVTGTLTLKDMTVKTPAAAIPDEISQYSKSAIALMNTGDVTCTGVTFEMKDGVADATAITAYWSTEKGTQIAVDACVFNCAGGRPIRSDANVTVTRCIFNDPYRYAVQMTAKASTATDLENAVVTFKNNTINAGPTSNKTVVYGIQLEGESYGCSYLIINGEGNTINLGNTQKTGTMYYCECGMVDHNTVQWNTEVQPVHCDDDYEPVALLNGVEYTTLDAALNSAEEGDTIQIVAGTHTRTQPISVTTDNLTIKGMGEEKTTVTGGDSKITQGLFYVFASGVTIQNMTINYTGNDNQTSAIKVTPESGKTPSDFTAKNLTVSSTGGHGINLSFVGGISVMDHVTVTSCVKTGLYFRCASANITDCNITGGTSWNKGIGCEVAASDTKPATPYALSVDDSTVINANTAKLDLNTGGHQVSYNLHVPAGWTSTTSGTNILYN